MKRMTVVLAALAIVLSATVAMAEITVGVVLSTTGPAASLGMPAKNSLAFAPKTIAGEKVRYVVYDDATDATNTVQSVKRLISEDKVDVIIGPSTTPTSLSVLDVASEAKTPLLSLGSASAIVNPVDAKRKWVFKPTANDDITARAMVAHMVKRGVKTAAVIAIDDPYGEANTKEYQALAEKNGIKTVTVEKFKKGDTSVTAQVVKVMSSKPDAVFIVAVGTPSATPHLALVERGYKGTIYQSHSTASSDFLKLGGKALEGSFLPAAALLVAEQLPNGYPTKAEALNFAKAFEPKFGPRSTFAAHMWDSLKIIEAAAPKALKVAKPGTAEFRAALRDAIEGTKGLKGAYAVFSLSPTDHSGVDQTGIAMLKIENGKWKLEDYAKFK